MTTVELAQHMIRNTDIDDLSAAPAAKANDVVRAMNVGVQKFFQAAPSRWSRTGASFLAGEPVSVDIDVTEDSVTVSNAPFTTAMRGCSILIPGTTIYNEIVSTDQLLYAWTGATGTVSAMVYFNAITITDFAVAQILTDPIILECDRRLVRQEQFDSISSTRPFRDGASSQGGRVGGGGRATSDYPIYYRVKYVGNSYASTDGDAVVILQMDPLPRVKFNVSFDLDVRPGTYRIGALETAVSIPVHDTIAYSTLLPMCEAAMTLSPSWTASDSITARIIAAGEEAEGMAASLTKRFAKPKRRIITRRGW